MIKRQDDKIEENKLDQIIKDTTTERLLLCMSEDIQRQIKHWDKNYQRIILIV